MECIDIITGNHTAQAWWLDCDIGFVPFGVNRTDVHGHLT